MKGFDVEQEEDDVRTALMEAFKDCGDISSMRLPSDRDTGALKGFGYIEFGSAEAKVRCHPGCMLITSLLV